MRARNIKPGFFSDEKLVQCSFGARLLFAGLWCFADREGRFLWKPKQIRLEVFPDQPEVDVAPLLGELSRHGLTCKYIVDEQTYGWLPHFLDHQRPHKHEAGSKFPPFSKEFQCHDISPVHVAAECTAMFNHVPAECLPDSLIPDSLIPEESADTPPLASDDPPEKKNGRHYSSKMCREDFEAIDQECKQVVSKCTKEKHCNPHSLVQGMINKAIHPRAVLRALQELNQRWTEIDIPYRYIQTIIGKLDFRAKEEAAIKESKTVARMWDEFYKEHPFEIPSFDMSDPDPIDEQDRIRLLKNQAAGLKGMS